MYSRQHRTSKSPANNSDTPASNQFAPRPFVVQPQAEPVNQQNQTADLQAKGEKTKEVIDGFPDASVFTRHVAPPKTPRVQMKLNIGKAGDKYEQEADKMAANVVQQINAPESKSIQRVETPLEEEKESVSVQAMPMVHTTSAIQRRIDTTASQWLEDHADIANPQTNIARTQTSEAARKYLRIFAVATGNRTLEQEKNRVLPFSSPGEATRINNLWGSITLNISNGWARPTWLTTMDNLVTAINLVADRVTTAGGEVNHGALRQTWGGTVEDLNVALDRAGGLNQLSLDLQAAKVELFDNRNGHRINQNLLLPKVRKTYENRANGPSIRGWGHRAGGSVVVFWIDGLPGYWDFAEVHAHINQSNAVVDGVNAGDFSIKGGAPANRAVNIRRPYQGIGQGDNVAPGPIVNLILGHNYDPARWGEAQGSLADF